MDHSNEQNFWFGGNKPFMENDKNFSTASPAQNGVPAPTAESISHVFHFDEPLLRDHVIYGEPVLVGAAYLSMFIDLVLQHNNRKSFRIQRLTYINALVITHQHSKTVTASVRHDNDRLLLQARVPMNGVDEVYAEGYVRNDAGDVPVTPALSLRELLSTAVKREFPEEKFYKHPDQVTYGPSLMSVFSVYRLADPAQVLGEIRLTEEMTKGLRDYYIHPALFDACHVTSSFVLGDDVVAQHRVPLMIKEIAIHYAGELSLGYAFCHVELVQSNEQIAEMNFRLADGNGLIIASAKGFVTKTVPGKDAIFSTRATAVNHTSDTAVQRVQEPASIKQRTQVPPVRESAPQASVPLEKAIREYLRGKLGQAIGSDGSAISLSQNFMDLGIESNNMVGIVQGIEREVGLELYPTLLFEHQNINALADFLARDYHGPFSAFLLSHSTPVAVVNPVPGAGAETNNIISTIIPEKRSAEVIDPVPASHSTQPVDLKKDIQVYLKQKIARLLTESTEQATSAEQVSVTKNFMDLGIDSNNMIGVVREIETECGIELFPTLLFERQNIEQLADYFVQESGEAFKNFLSTNTPLPSLAPDAVSAVTAPAHISASQSTVPSQPVKHRDQPLPQASGTASTETSRESDNIPNPSPVNADYRTDAHHQGNRDHRSSTADDDIAIVGMSGYLPQSADLREFWQHLENGDDLVSEIPADHWDIDAWYSADKKAGNKTYSRWGGFLNNIDKFDAHFFGISPRQAEWIDPQLRLLLQSVQHTLEDACQINSVFGSKTGVYVGCCFQEYWDEIVRAQVPLVDYQADSSVMSSLAATVAYMFDLQGGAVPLDNACASSLTALHLACQSLRTGENEQAVVAGVNALLSPLHYVYFSRMQALSPTGRCYAFDKKANGYVPGEGTVSILIKPLKKALADGDNIHAIIKASGINHVGRSNNAVSPRPELQTRLLRDTWDRFGVNPADFTYMEAHGTGTVLGDPIEVNALKAAFKPYTRATGFCTLGSTKAHVGHLEGAAGLASVIKVILMMKHRKIPKMPNFEELNPYIKLSDSPFEINRELLDWRVPTGKKRLAGVSAFGMTGNNSHVVLEEYIAPERVAGSITIKPSYFIPLSAKTPERLKAGVKMLLEYLQRVPSQPALADLSFSLQVGRQSMPERLVLCVASHEDLMAQLNYYLQESTSAFIHGRAPAEIELTDHFPDQESFVAHLQSLYRAGALADIAQLWIKGLQPDWASLRNTENARKISLPGYSFAPDRYWIPEQYKQAGSTPVAQPPVPASGWQARDLKQALHPLVHENCSNFETIRFCTSLSGTEFFVDEHRINGERVLPGVAYLEMAIAGAELATQKKTLVLRNISWIRPVVVTEKEKELVTTLTSQGEEVKFKISSDADGLHCQGIVVSGDRYPSTKIVDLAEINRSLSGEASAERIYNEFQAQGIEYGPAFRSLEYLRYSHHETCAHFVLQQERAIDASAFRLHPGIMDAALQATIGLKFANAVASTEKKLELPFAINAVHIYSSTPVRGYMHVRYSPGSGFHDRVSNHDIDICDERGNICISIIGFSTRTILVDESSQGSGASTSRTSIPAARQQTSAAISRAENVAASIVSTLSLVKNYLQHNVADILKLRVEDVPLDEEMGAYGLDSITLTELSNRISRDLDLQLAPTVFFEYATLENFSIYLSNDFSANIDRYFSRLSTAPDAGVTAGSAPVAELNSNRGDNNINDDAQLERLLQEKVGAILKLSPDEITLDESMSSFGLDSITLTELSNFVVDTFNIQLTPTIFFEHTTLESFANYLRAEHRDAIDKVIGGNAITGGNFPSSGDAFVYQAANGTQEASTQKNGTQGNNAQDNNTQESIAPVSLPGFVQHPDEKIPQQKNWNDEDIAIVGISGCFPMADNIHEFWQNIAQGKDCISEIPADRWDWREIFGDPLMEENKSNVKWGGFIQDLDKFDPLFFGISPREAELMDPQQRLLLEHAWAAIEDAGHSAKDFWDSATGVFIGTSTTGYHKRVLEADIPIEGHSSTAVVPSAGPNRLSYYLNLHGPSEPIETACSSALVAIHRGILAIQSGECDQVLAGGINTLLSPEVHLSFNKAGMLCEDGRCKTFSSDANGYVRGEGAGIVLLKRLDAAKKDRNTIYAVIKGSAENHGGRAQSLTAPNVNAQVDLLVSAYAKAKIDPRTVTYIEAHGTGTPLGDPIEINALKKAFNRLYELNGATGETVAHCGIGSVKSNIGHLELAAGIAGLTKVLLAMKQGVLPPSIHCEQTNPYIDLGNSPFYIVKNTQAWQRSIDSAGRELPRRAGISSFGFGGVNAHLVLEEYLDPDYDDGRTPETGVQTLYPLSAKSELSLKNNAQRLRDFLANNSPSLKDVAFTLQVGRVSMEHRLAVVAADKTELLQLLDSFIAGNTHPQLFTGVAGAKGTALLVDAHTQPAALAQAWLKNGYFQWAPEYIQQLNPKRIPLPTYAFARDRHWLDQKPFAYARAENKPVGTGEQHLLPLHNASTLFEQKYRAEFNGGEWYFAEHRVKGQKIFPGVAYIELARAAAEQAAQQRVIRIEGLSWSAPLVAGTEKPCALAIHLSPEVDASTLAFGIYDVNGTTVHSEGRVQLADAYQSTVTRDLGAIKSRCTGFYAKEFIYQAFSEMGLEYGRAFRAIEELFSNGTEVFARLRLPDPVENSLQASILPPSLLDAALQSVIGFSLHRQAVARNGGKALPARREPYVPFAVENLSIHSPLQQELFVYATEIASADSDAGIAQYNIDILNAQGEVCIRLEKFTARRLRQQDAPAPTIAQNVLVGNFVWGKATAPVTNPSVAIPDNAKIIVANIDAANRLKQLSPALDIYPLRCGDSISERALREDFLQVFEQVQALLAQRKREPSRVFVIVPDDIEAFRSAAFAGLLKTAQLENPALVARLLYVAESHLANPELLLSLMANETGLTYPLVEVAYNPSGLRCEKTWRDLEISGDAKERHSLAIKPGGTYWISGGMGGLGIIFAKHILGYERTRVILSGRSPLDTNQQEIIDALGNDRVEYLALDFNNEQNVRDAFARVKAQYRSLNGIVHSAGVIRDAFILKKTPTQIAEVWAGKVGGLLALDNACSDEPLDFFISFSSIAGCFGSLGQADYSGANSVLDAYMAHRNDLVRAGKRHGASIAIAWPLWAEGGMQVDQAIREQMEKMSGLVPLTIDEGIAAFDSALHLGAEQFIVLAGNHSKLRRSLPIGQAMDIAEVDNAETNTLDTNNPEPELLDSVAADIGGQPLDAEVLRRKTIEYLKRYLADALKMPAHKVDENADLEKYGIDSVMVLKLGAELEKLFGRLPKTLFYEYKNIRELSHYFITRQREKLIALIAPNVEKVSSAVIQPVKALARAPLPKMQPRGGAGERQALRDESMQIAIVGMDGRYPQADNLAEFWENLRSGRDCISEIPSDRWNHADFYSGDKNQSGSVYSKWGGFVADVDKFDPLFFNISPREAEAMDPQERLFLQSAWKCLEDSGYTRKNISQAESGRRNIGVFVGVMYEEYQLYAAQEQLKGNLIGLGGNPSSIANRVSYICDFNGPSMAIDTMCSSSLTAIHLACQSLREGKCSAALAGGVNLSVHPNKYIFLSQGKFISTSGRCESFGMGGDGYVPGEGVGCLLLKPLAAAERDGDHIYGIIRGSALNHGGKTNGYTVPNPLAQSEVIRQAMEDARVEPRAISYIEAHGTGTSLGDPIEISGLSRAFADAGIAAQSCALGSAKSNIGHCESAAGIAGISKVLLQMKHGQIAPSIHSETLNPNIDFTETPFIVQQHLGEWQRPTINNREYNRIAGVSSFGAGGSNAHIILEEYRQPVARRQPDAVDSSRLILLSARTPESLREYANNVKHFIDAQPDQLELESLAYTLATGREAMEYRLAFSADSLALTRERLADFLQGDASGADVYYGNTNERTAVTSLAADSEFMQVLVQWMGAGKLEKVAELWVQGMDIPWEKIYQEVSGFKDRQWIKISLPTYPFARERYWVDTTGSIAVASNTPTLHRLLSSNISDLYTQKYRSDFIPSLPFVADHKMNGDYILPGVVYLEMARAAGELAGLKPVVALQNIVWSAPVVFRDKQPVTTTIHLAPTENPVLVGFEVFSQDGARLHAEGQIQLEADDSAGDSQEHQMDLDHLRNTCTTTFDKDAIYQAFARQGMDYGQSLQCLAEAGVGDGQVFARAILGKSDGRVYALQPGLLDAALQSLIGFALDEQQRTGPDNNARKVFVPFSLERVQLLAALPDEIYIHAREATADSAANIRYYDIDIADTDGNLCVTLRGLSVRQLAETNDPSTAKPDVFYGKFSWQADEPINRKQRVTLPPDNAQELFRLVIGNATLASTLEQSFGQDRVSVLSPVEEFSEAALRQQFVQVFTRLRDLFQAQAAARKNLVICVPAHADGIESAHLGGLIKSARQEHPQLNAKVVLLDEALLDDATLVENIISAESRFNDGQEEVRYTANGQRLVKKWQEIIAPHHNPVTRARRDKGVYWISGGLGGLGVIIARHLLAQSNSRVILSGRSVPTDKQQSLLAELGDRAEYLRVDIANHHDVETAFRTLKEKYGKIDGVIHSAGVIRDAFLVKKTEQEIADVWRAKISGALHLDEVTRQEPLDFFIAFSSIAGTFGSVGQADYSAANSLLDAFCVRRNRQVAQGNRSGTSIALAWPLWKEGGMQLDTATITQLARASGMWPLETADGCTAFDVALNLGLEQLVILNGDKEKITRRLLTVDNSSDPVVAVHEPETVTRDPRSKNDTDTVREAAETYLKTLLAKTLKLPSHRIDASQPLEKYGIDSVMVMTLTNDLETQFGDLSKTLFFEYKSIAELAGYFIQAHPVALQQAIGIKPDTSLPAKNKHRTGEKANAINPVRSNAEKSSVSAKAFRRFSLAQGAATTPASDLDVQKPFDVAIIGISGRYPQSVDLEAFWDNLKNGNDCITEIPAERWDLHRYFGTDGSPVYSKWGGFIQDVDKFDPLFFNISPREAEIIDPQERLFLQHAWECMENAGYTRSSIISPDQVERDVGVFVGVMYEEYQLFGAQEQLKGNLVGLTANPSGIANRVSYFCDFRGPSMAVDTMCSSSLTAIHLACQSLRDKQCSVALAGGVNISIHPNKYLLLSQGKFISSRGRCESFGKGGDGYVPGEGVGCLLLKPLAQAEADGDFIYGVIKGSAINHGGKTNGYTVPNPVAQARVIDKALNAAQLPATAISYIEAHGTGTSLGDPIEITGLNKVFLAAGVEPGSCAIGSAKSNIGHCESAAGVAGVTKVLLQMQHGMLVPSIHSSELNPNIDFARSAFNVQQELAEWKRKTVDGVEVPRVAGISSFGAGGSNAHIIIQEYRGREIIQYPQSHHGDKNQLTVISARSSAQLVDYAQRYIDFLDAQPDSRLEDIALSSQIGREEFKHRLALVSDSTATLRSQLLAVVSGQAEIAEGIFMAKVAEDTNKFSLLTRDDDLRQGVERWIEKGKLNELAELWVAGLAIDWSLLRNANPSAHKIPVPSYPFLKTRYWFSTENTEASVPGLPLREINYGNPGFWEKGDVPHSAGLRENLVANAGKTILLLTDSLPIQIAYTQFIAALNEILSTLHAPAINARFQLIDATGKTPVMEPVDIIFLIAASHANVIGNPEQQAEALRKIASDYSRAPVYTLVDTGKAQGAMLLDSLYQVAQQKEAHQAPRYYVGVDYSLSASYAIKVAFNELFANGTRQSVSVCRYLEDVRWVKQFNSRAPAATLTTLNPEQQIHLVEKRWRKSVPVAAAPHNSPGKVLLVCNNRNQHFIEEYRQRFIGRDCLALVITADNPQEKPDGSRVFIGLQDSEAAATAMRSLLQANGVIGSVIDISSLGIDTDQMDRSGVGIYTLYQHLVRQFTGMQILHFTNNLQHLNSETTFSLSGAKSAGLIKMLSAEYAHINAKTIDIDNAALVGESFWKILADETAAPLEETEIAYRKSERFVPFLQRDLSNKKVLQPIGYDEHGAYLIAGGTSGIGLKVAFHLADKGVKKLVLLGATTLPAEQEWESLAQANSTPEPLRKKLSAFVSLKKSGVDLKIYSGSLLDETNLGNFIAAVKREWGRIRGVVHSAGAMSAARDGEFAFVRKNSSQVANVFAPKIEGTEILHNLVAGDDLDFFVAFSSTSGSLPNFMRGLSDYGTANAFIDYFVNYQAGRRATRYRSIAWVGWSDTGSHTRDIKVQQLAVDGAKQYGLLFNDSKIGLEMFDYALACDSDGAALLPCLLNVDVFDSRVQDLLRCEVQQPAPKHSEDNNKFSELLKRLSSGSEPVGPEVLEDIDLDSLEEWQIEKLSSVFLEQPPVPAQSPAPAPANVPAGVANIEAITPVLPSIDNIQKLLIELMSDILKVDRGSIEKSESFQSYGLDSISGTQLTSKLEQALNFEMSSAWLLEYSTVNELSQMILKKLTGSKELV